MRNARALHCMGDEWLPSLSLQVCSEPFDSKGLPQDSANGQSAFNTQQGELISGPQGLTPYELEPPREP